MLAVGVPTEISMKLIAIESSGNTGSVAALSIESQSAPAVVIERPLPADRRSAQTLAATLAELLAKVEWQPEEVDFVSVPIGPGSFTGLRVGVTTAKMFAYAVGARVVPINTLDVLAHQARATGLTGPIATVMDAQRREVFSATYSANENTAETTITAIDAWLTGLRQGDLVVGPFLSRLKQRLPAEVSVADESLWQPSAAAVGHLAIDAALSGNTLEAWQLVPDYYRKSAAEEKADEKTEAAS